MRCGIVAVDAAAEDGNGMAVRLERAAMRFAVDPTREAADDHDAGGRELAPEHARNLGAVRRARAGADDRDRGAREQRRITVASQIEPSGRIVDRPQQRRQLALA